EAVALERPDLVLLLGWMHLLAEPFVRTFPGLLNIHPAFLPLDPARDDVVAPDGARIAAFRGARAVRDAIAAGSPWTGATLHAVTPQTDRGPVLARRPMRLSPTDDEETALARLHPLEHEVVAAGIRRWLFER
ncbi:MAG TPA: formyltransferase family protein, partial [Verrucomicrobiae bacterium]|nr:formyltransferase family protein [Verrucomicrobiae bacterium]